MKRILVVEDSRNNLYLIDFILSHEGYTVIKAGNGEEGIEQALLKEKPDLILMDLQLPGIDGLEAARRIRRSGIDHDIPIVALTSYAMAGDMEKALAAGCTDYLEKPIDPDTFLDQIATYLYQSRSASALRKHPASTSTG